MKQLTKRSKTKFLVSSLALSLFLALAAIEARSGNTPRVFVYMLLTWISYMISHKAAVGKFIDGKETSEEDGKDEKMAPKDLVENTGFLLGSVLFISGMITGAYGLHLLQRPLTVLGSVVFIMGYVVSHQSTTGELL